MTVAAVVFFGGPLDGRRAYLGEQAEGYEVHRYAGPGRRPQSGWYHRPGLGVMLFAGWDVGSGTAAR